MRQILSFYRGKRVLITGHTGFKGGWLCRMLALAGAEICGYSLLPRRESFYSVCGGVGRHEVGDVRDIDRLYAVVNDFRPQIVFHLAAQPIVAEGYRQPLETYGTNFMGTINLLECVRSVSAVESVLLVTTDKVYAESAHLNREEDRLDGYDPYSNSKSCCELAAACYRRCSLLGTVALSTARAGNVLGGGDFAKSRILPDCVRAAERGEPILVRNPDAVRPYHHVLEALSAYLAIAHAQSEDCSVAGAYNVGPPENASVRTADLVEMFCDIWGEVTWKTVSQCETPRETPVLRIDSERLHRMIGWYPRKDLAWAVEKTVEWEKARRAGADMAAVTDRQIQEYLAD